MRDHPLSAAPRIRLALAATTALCMTAPLSVPSALEGQPPADSPSLRIFLDCDACDFDHLRREITFVDYVRQSQAAELHVIVTSQETATGGDRLTFFFIGQDRFAGRTDTLEVTVAQDASDAERRDDLTLTLALGLVPYAARTGLSRGMRIGFDDEARGTGAGPATPEDDPWNLWVLRTSLGTQIQGESSESEISGEGSVSASRVTDRFKVHIRLAGDYVRQTFKADDDEPDEEDLTLSRREYEGSALGVWSIGDNWAAGAFGRFLTSSRVNLDLATEFAPAIEYSIYPYAESTRRQILLTYWVGPVFYDYEEVTLFGARAETLGKQTLQVTASFLQPWGEMGGSLEGSTFLHDAALHRIELDVAMEVRLFRGLGLEIEGQVARVKDQIFLPAGGLSPEEILLGLRERGTDYEYEVEVGFSYTFGSVFNNVVNPRMMLR